jgi:hypothetical protein
MCLNITIVGFLEYLQHLVYLFLFILLGRSEAKQDSLGCDFSATESDACIASEGRGSFLTESLMKDSPA